MNNFVKAAAYAVIAVVAEVVLLGWWKPLNGDAGWRVAIVSLTYSSCVALALAAFGYEAGEKKSVARAIGYLFSFSSLQRAYRWRL
jgi:hypothetical protein